MAVLRLLHDQRKPVPHTHEHLLAHSATAGIPAHLRRLPVREQYLLIRFPFTSELPLARP